MEDTHESPIQAFRKPALRGRPLALDSDDDSTEGKVGPSLLRKLLCLKAKSSKLHKHHWGLGASPLSKAGAGCGPVAALSRTADPHGESPLRWKPRAEMQSPPETSSVTEPEKTGCVSSPGASCATKPWKSFRALMSSRAKKGSVLPENEQDRRVTEGGDLGLSAGTPATHMEKSTGEPPRHTVAAGSDEDGICRTQKENESPRTAQPGLEIHGRTGDIAELDSMEELCSLGEEHGRPPEDMDMLQRQGSGFSGVSVGDAEGGSTEDQDPDQEDDRYWEEAMAGGDQDLADLAENPGGQGMVMGTRDLGWLTREALGGSTIRPVFALINHDSCQTKEEKVISGFITPKFHHVERMMVVGAASAEADADRTAKTVPTDQQGSLEPSPPCEISGACTLEESGPPFPCFSQDLDLLASPPRCSSFSAREQDPPALQPSSSFNTAPTGRLQGSHTKMAPPGPEIYKASAQSAASMASEDTQSKQRLYRAAAEIVGAAIDAAAEQLAQKEAKGWGPEDDSAGGPVPRAATQGAEESL